MKKKITYSIGFSVIVIISLDCREEKSKFVVKAGANADTDDSNDSTQSDTTKIPVRGSDSEESDDAGADIGDTLVIPGDSDSSISTGEGDSNPCEGISCTSPPDNVCIAESSLAVFDPNGICENGRCSYSSREEVCAVGKCVGRHLRGSPLSGNHLQ